MIHVIIGSSAMKGLFTALLIPLLIGGCKAPSLLPYEPYFFGVPFHSATEQPELNVVFLGASTLLFDDGETAIMTDAFFSRPGISRLGKLAPDESVIDAALSRLNATTLAAVIPLHTHYDHVLDAPYVARTTGALFVGSQSAANVGRGHGLPRDQVRIVDAGDRMQFGRFRLTFLLSAHGPPDIVPGSIEAAIASDASLLEYKTGECYSVLIEHGARTILVHASAGFVDGALAPHRADVVFLGVGALGKQPESYVDAYWTAVVRAVHARRVVPIHWDDFFRSLDHPLVPMSPLIDNFDRTMRLLLKRARADGVDLRMAQSWQPFDPLSGLSTER